MKISRNSWHYKMNKFWWCSVEHDMPDLWSYFWTTAFILFGQFVGMCFILLAFYMIITAMIENPWDFLTAMTVVIGLISMIIVPPIVIRYTRKKFHTDKMEIMPSVIKALKDKCPIIEYVD